VVVVFHVVVAKSLGGCSAKW